MDVPDLEETIEEYRHRHESAAEWTLRRAFLLTHRDRYPLDRLRCLAACFINHEVSHAGSRDQGWRCGIMNKKASDEYKHGLTVPKTHRHIPLVQQG